ncbi:unnamed protein product [Coregonus sp. 'balchen']|nr:unnamed protein product [Coregonus sp. 'balchen']
MEETATTEEAEELKTSSEGIAFLSSIGATEMQQCVFEDSLVTVSEGGRELGEFKVTVERSSCREQPCLLLHAHSHGAIDNTPCGTAITAYLSLNLETLEQNHHEYVKDHRLDRKCHMVQRDGQLVVNKITTVGERELGCRQQTVGEEVVEVFGVERTVDLVEDIPATWHCYFLPDG